MSASTPQPWLSLIIPTRHNCGQLRRFLDSLLALTDHPADLEIVLVVDEDDQASREFSHPGHDLVRVVCPPGLPMGALNQAGYQASSGRYLMLMNDDVEVRTKGWDLLVRDWLGCFADDMVLIHVNDLTFKEKLCVFPLVSRAFCQLAGGICPTAYRRYRIDDHLYNVFNLLALLGHRRIVYLPDVVFCHRNFSRDLKLRRVYRFDKEVMADDAQRFDTLMPQRKLLARRMAAAIQERAGLERRRLEEARLELVEDGISLRVAGYQRQAPADPALAWQAARLGVGLVAPEAGALPPGWPACLEREKPGLEIITLTGPPEGAGRSAQWNRLLSMAAGDYFLLLEGCGEMEPGWLPGLWRQMGVRVGLALAPLPGRPLGAAAGCALLLDMCKIGHLRFEEVYEGPLAVVDLALRVWESGFQVAGLAEHPDSLWENPASPSLRPPPWEDQAQAGQRFKRHWLEGGRLAALEDRCRDWPGWSPWGQLAARHASRQWPAAQSPAAGPTRPGRAGLWHRLRGILREVRIPVR